MIFFREPPFDVFMETQILPSTLHAWLILLSGFLILEKASRSRDLLSFVRSSWIEIPDFFSFSFFLFLSRAWRCWYDVSLTMIALGFGCVPSGGGYFHRTRWLLSMAPEGSSTSSICLAMWRIVSSVFSLSVSGTPKKRTQFRLEYCSWSLSFIFSLLISFNVLSLSSFSSPISFFTSIQFTLEVVYLAFLLFQTS